MLEVYDNYIADEVGDWYRLQFKVKNRLIFYSILETLKQLHGTRPEKHGTNWYWWVVKNEHNAGILKSLKFPIEHNQKTKIALRGLPKQIRDYQREGVQFLVDSNGSALLADDMGLGKTLQALGYLLVKQTYPVIVVCPSTLKINWMREYFKWCDPKREVKILSGRTPRRTKADVYIINYDILSGWVNTLLLVDPKLIIADEATYIKNTTAIRTRAFKTLAAGRKLIAITGTPIENRPMELYTVLNLLRPSMFPSKIRFGNRYCDPKRNYFTGFIEYKGSSNEGELHGLLKTIMIRRLKKDVLKELPEKQRIVIPLDKDTGFDRKYSTLVNEIRAGANNKKGIEIKNKVEALKQLAVKMKMKAALKWIRDYLDTGNKLVLFGWHVDVCREIYNEFKSQSVLLIGGISPVARQKAVDRFQEDDKVRLFVGNIQAAGVGITLTAAPATAFIEFDWSPGRHSQAEDRVHRIGQESDSVNAYYLVAPDTIDEWLMEMIDTKQGRVDAIIDGKESDENMMLTALLHRFTTGSTYGSRAV